jgi:hypothetical protein
VKPDRSPLPDARTHLPKPIERRLLKPYEETLSGRVAAAATLRALSVLFRKHPKAAFHALAAGAVQAGRTGATEARNKIASLWPRRRWENRLNADDVAEARQVLMSKLDKRKLRRLRRLLKRH